MNKKTLIACLAALPFIAAALLPTHGPSAQAPFEVGPLKAAPGRMTSGFLPVPAGKDGAERVPVTIFNGASTGPVLAVVAGIHGYEYPPVLAGQRLLAKIDPAKLKGMVILVHVANMPSFLKRTVYYSPVDGENLNRVFPGRADGTLSHRIAYVITREVIERADYLIDMHCGDGNESLRPYSYWMPIGDPKVDEPARRMAVAFGMPNIVIDRTRPKSSAASQYCSNTGMTRGKPSITVESGGMGVADNEDDIARLETGVLNVMRHLGMLEGRVSVPDTVTWYDPAEVLRFPDNLPEKAGLFYPSVRKGQTVDKGALIGYVTDFFGKKIYEARAPFAGEVLYVIGTPPISAGEPLGFVAAVKK